MQTNDWLLIAVFVIGVVGLIGFFATKRKGFGKFATSVLLLLLIVIMSGLFYAAGKMQPELLGNIFFAVVGFAGGLFAGKEKSSLREERSVGN
jgi:hypothetical protein